MKLKVGELAKRSGLTVRALHHYDRIGLLSPSARTDAGYRLYDRADIARLHRIQALRRFGMGLADIGAYLAEPDAELSTIVDQQIAALTRQIEHADALRTQLTRLQVALKAGAEPPLAAWLTTLELMTMYDTYFTKDELKRLSLLNGDPACMAHWDQMVGQCRQMIASGTSPGAPEARDLAQQWMMGLDRDTGGDPDIMARILTMHANEPAQRAKSSITPEIKAFLGEAFTRSRLDLYKPYLSPAEFAFMAANYRKRAEEWPFLIARVRKAFDAGLAPDDPAVRALFREWLDLTRSFAGDDPATLVKIRLAHENEPRLAIGSWIRDDMKGFIGEGMAALRKAG